MPKKILEPDHQRESHPSITRFIDHIHQVDGLGIRLRWHDLDVPGGVDIEVPAAPPINIVEGYRRRNVPVFSHCDATLCDRASNSIRSCEKLNKRFHSLTRTSERKEAQVSRQL